MKTCRSCKEEKEQADFYKKLSNSDGLYSYCKKCCKDRGAENWKKRKTKESCINYVKEYREKNKDISRQQCREYYKKNKETILKQVESYRNKNKKEISLREALRRISDPDRFEKNRLRHYEWSKNHREEINEFQRNWYQKNKEKRKAHVVLNRAVNKGIVMRPESCSECNKKCKPDGHHEDYSKPLEVVWICRACHSRKSPRTVVNVFFN